MSEQLEILNEIKPANFSLEPLLDECSEIWLSVIQFNHCGSPPSENTAQGFSQSP